MKFIYAVTVTLIGSDEKPAPFMLRGDYVFQNPVSKGDYIEGIIPKSISTLTAPLVVQVSHSSLGSRLHTEIKETHPSIFQDLVDFLGEAERK